MLNNTIIPWDGNKITKPGIYSGISLEAYHTDICDGPSISSSGLRTIDQLSPLHYFDTSYLNPEYEAPEPKTFFSLGSAIHHLVAGEDAFAEKFAIRPSEWADWRTKAAKEWRAQQLLNGKSVLTESDLVTIRGVAKQLHGHPLIEAGILNGLPELSIFWKVEVPIEGTDDFLTVWLKSRPDNIPLSENMIVDLKTGYSAAPHTVRNSIAEHGYHIQLALVYEGLLATWGRRMEDFVLVFVETSRPFAINIKPLDTTDVLEYGRRQIKRALLRFAYCYANGVWPGYDDDEKTAKLPDWYRNRLAYQAENGLLPPVDMGGIFSPPEEIF